MWSWNDGKLFKHTLKEGDNNFISEVGIPVPEGRSWDKSASRTVDSRNNFYFLENGSIYRYTYSGNRWPVWHELVIDLKDKIIGNATQIWASGDAIFWIKNDDGQLFDFRYDAMTHRVLSDVKLLFDSDHNNPNGRGFYRFNAGSGIGAGGFIFRGHPDGIFHYKYNLETGEFGALFRNMGEGIWKETQWAGMWNGTCQDNFALPALPQVAWSVPNKIAAASSLSDAKAGIGYISAGGSSVAWASSSTMDASWGDSLPWTEKDDGGELQLVDSPIVGQLPEGIFSLLVRAQNGILYQTHEKTKENKDLVPFEDLGGGFGGDISASTTSEGVRYLTGVDERGEIWISTTNGLEPSSWKRLKTDVKSMPNAKVVTVGTGRSMRMLVKTATGLKELAFDGVSVTPIEEISLPVGIVLRGAPAMSLLSNKAGRIAIVDDPTGDVWVISRDPGGKFSGWKKLDFTRKAIGDISVYTHTNGRGYISVRSADEHVLFASEMGPGSGTYKLHETSHPGINRDPASLTIKTSNGLLTGYVVMSDTTLKFNAIKISGGQSLAEADSESLQEIFNIPVPKSKNQRKK